MPGLVSACSSKGDKMLTVDLRQDQWDLIVLSLQHVRAMTTESGIVHPVDKVGRIFLRRCIDETVTDIRVSVPEKST